MLQYIFLDILLSFINLISQKCIRYQQFQASTGFTKQHKEQVKASNETFSNSSRSLAKLYTTCFVQSKHVCFYFYNSYNWQPDRFIGIWI